jgi:Dolichyl-phosphate-mannose-protein mannosyltransferase
MTRHLVASSRSRAYLSLLAFLTFLLVPGAPDSVFSGVPLTEIALAGFLIACVAIALVALFEPTRRPAWTWALILLTLATIKVALAQGTVPGGWRGVYELIDDPPTGPISFMAGTSTRPFRIDRRIEFDGPSFNLPFLNDFLRYGNHYSRHRREVEFPFRVQWTGYVLLAEQGPLSLTASCRGDLTVTVDGASAFNGQCPGDEHLNVTTRTLTEGPHIVAVTYTKPPFVNPGAVIHGNVSKITPSRVSRKTENRSAFFTALTTILGWSACAIACLALVRAYAPLPAKFKTVTRQELARIAVLATFALLLLYTFRISLGLRSVTANIPTGDDPIAYETFARDIFFNGPLMPAWQQPYYFYPLYPYILAPAHVLFGEDLSSAAILNGACLASIALVFWWLGWKRLPGWAVAIGLAMFGWFCWKYYWPFVPSAYTDHLFALLVFVTILATVRAVTSWSWSAWFVAGLAAAAGAATRPSLMTYPLVLAAFIVLGWTEKQPWLRIRAALVMAAGFLTGLAPFTIRNFVVSGTPVLLVNSWIQIPYFLYDPNEPNKATQVFGLWEALQQAATLFAARPIQVIAIELRKLGFTLGWLKLGPSGEPATLEFVTLFLLFLEALLLARIPKVLAFVLCAFAVSHIAAMILAAPWTYVYKPILSLHLVFLFGAAFLAHWKEDAPPIQT